MFFKGSEGAFLKPFVPSQQRPTSKASDVLTKPLSSTGLTQKTASTLHQSVQDESMMSRHEMPDSTDTKNSDFAFMH